MIHVKYVSMKVNKNLLKQNVDIKYVLIALHNWIIIIILKNVHYVEKRIGFNFKYSEFYFIYKLL